MASIIERRSHTIRALKSQEYRRGKGINKRQSHDPSDGCWESKSDEKDYIPLLEERDKTTIRSRREKLKERVAVSLFSNGSWQNDFD